MRAAQQQGVDGCVTNWRQQSLGQDGDLVAGGDPTLDELDETWARRAREVDVDVAGRRCLGHGALVRTRSDGADGADDADSTAAGGVDQRLRAGLDDADHGHLELGRQVDRRCRGVARDHDDLGVVFVDQESGDLTGVAGDLGLRLRAIRVAAGVADVDDVLGGQQVDHGAGDRQATEATVEHADRPVHRCVHRADTLPAGQIRRQARPIRRPVMASR